MSRLLAAFADAVPALAPPAERVCGSAFSPAARQRYIRASSAFENLCFVRRGGSTLPPWATVLGGAVEGVLAHEQTDFKAELLKSLRVHLGIPEVCARTAAPWALRTRRALIRFASLCRLSGQGALCGAPRGPRRPLGAAAVHHPLHGPSRRSAGPGERTIELFSLSCALAACSSSHPTTAGRESSGARVGMDGAGPAALPAAEQE